MKKKMLVLAMTGIMAICCFTGCGKSKEEKALEEFENFLMEAAGEESSWGF